MGNIDDGIRRTSIRIAEELARDVDRLAFENERSFNNQLLILVKKGIKLVDAETYLINSLNPMLIVKEFEQANNVKPFSGDDKKDPEYPGHRP